MSLMGVFILIFSCKTQTCSCLLPSRTGVAKYYSFTLSKKSIPPEKIRKRIHRRTFISVSVHFTGCTLKVITISDDRHFFYKSTSDFFCYFLANGSARVTNWDDSASSESNQGILDGRSNDCGCSRRNVARFDSVLDRENSCKFSALLFFSFSFLPFFWPLISV